MDKLKRKPRGKAKQLRIPFQYAEVWQFYKAEVIDKEIFDRNYILYVRKMICKKFSMHDTTVKRIILRMSEQESDNTVKRILLRMSEQEKANK